MKSLISKLKPKYLYDGEGNKTGVILSEKEFESLMEELEDLYDYELLKKQSGKKEKLYTAEEIREETLARLKAVSK
jgi:PHD/YefM family antitoxin component YafN of YafNO toxin-antitoxin module